MSPEDFRISQTEQAVSIHFCLLISRAYLWQPRRNCNDKQGGGEGGRGKGYCPSGPQWLLPEQMSMAKFLANDQFLIQWLDLSFSWEVMF